MKKDINFPKVEDVAVAIVREEDEGQKVWTVYLLNLKDIGIDNVMISSKGYGSLEGKDVKTSMLRHFFEKVKAKSFVKVEHFPDDLFSLSNEFWVSFYVSGEVHDKKYIFLAESVVDEHMITIPILNKKGVMIK